MQDGRLADEYSRPNLPTERRLKDGIKTRVVSVFASSCRCSRLAEGEFLRFVSEGEIHKSYERGLGCLVHSTSALDSSNGLLG